MINFDDKVCVLQLLGHKVWIVLKANLGHLLRVRGTFMYLYTLIKTKTHAKKLYLNNNYETYNRICKQTAPECKLPKSKA